MDIQNTWLVLLPAVITVCVAVVSRRPIESLLAGILVGLLMLGPTTALDQFSNMLLEVMMSETIAWVIIVCGLMGSLIMLLLRVGSVDAFSEALAAKAKSSKSALMYTWLLGIIVFIDDYLNALAVGAAMRKVTDQFGVSREKLAFVVDSTAAPICVLVPISTWAVFYASLFQESGFAEPGQGMDLYISAIPYMIYPIVAVLLVPLVALEVIPAFGPMKAAELRSAQSPLRQPATLTDEDNTQEPDREVRLYHFLLPLATLIGFTLWYELDVQIGVIASVTLTILLFGAQRLLAWTEMFDAVLDGIKMMLPALTIVVIAFVFKEVNDQLGYPTSSSQISRP